jgi:hypothetical protein
MMRIIESIRIFAAAGGAGGVVGALTHDQILTWTGATIAVGSAILSAAVAAYHKLREARRDEDAADRKIQLDDIRALTRVQVELEIRISQAETRLEEVKYLIDRVRCKFPNPDGTARCGSETPNSGHQESWSVER